MHRFQTVEGYLSSQPQPLCDVGLALAVLIDAELPDAHTGLWHGHPTWRIGRAPVCLVKAYTRHVTFGLWRGAEIDDPGGRLVSAGAQTMASVKLRTVVEIDADLFSGWLRQAHALERR